MSMKKFKHKLKKPLMEQRKKIIKTKKHVPPNFQAARYLMNLNKKDTSTVLYEHKPTINDLHPTMKPIKLMGKLIKNSSKRNAMILDLFGGSGSTLIACEQLNRCCYVMEYDPKYCDVIIKRWEELTGKKAELINE